MLYTDFEWGFPGPMEAPLPMPLVNIGDIVLKEKISGAACMESLFRAITPYVAILYICYWHNIRSCYSFRT